MKHIWSVLCEKSAIDFENNLVSMFNCVEELSLVLDKASLSAPDLIIPAQLQLISFWTIDQPDKDNKLEFRGEIIDPSGQSLQTFNNAFKIAKGVKRFRNRTNIQGLPIKGEGRYYFRLAHKEEGQKDFSVISELPLDIKISYQILDNRQVSGEGKKA